MKVVLRFAIFGLVFLLALYGVKHNQVFEVYGVTTVGAFLASMLGARIVVATSPGYEHKIISAILSSCAAVLFCSISFGIIWLLRYAKEVI